MRVSIHFQNGSSLNSRGGQPPGMGVAVVHVLVDVVVAWVRVQDHCRSLEMLSIFHLKNAGGKTHRLKRKQLLLENTSDIYCCKGWWVVRGHLGYLGMQDV